MVSGRLTLALSLALILGGAGIWSARTLSNPDRGPVDANWERIRAEGVLVVGIDPSIPPFGSLQNDVPAGLDPDISRAIATRLGLEVRFVLLSFDGLYDSLLLNHVDMVVAALRPDPLRGDRVRYTTAYFDAGQVIVAPAMPPPLESWRGKRLAVEFASEGDMAARQISGIQIERFFTAAEAIDAIRRGKADAALVDRVSALEAIRDDEGLFIANETSVPDPYVIAVRRSDWRLYGAVQAALEAIQSDGTLADLIQKWLGE